MDYKRLSLIITSSKGLPPVRVRPPRLANSHPMANSVDTLVAGHLFDLTISVALRCNCFLLCSLQGPHLFCVAVTSPNCVARILRPLTLKTFIKLDSTRYHDIKDVKKNENWPCVSYSCSSFILLGLPLPRSIPPVLQQQCPRGYILRAVIQRCWPPPSLPSTHPVDLST